MRLTGKEAAEVDAYAINRIGIPSIVLMENAALAALKHIDLVNNIKYTVLVGPGNNGADGLAMTRHLLNYGHHVEVIILGGPSESNPEYMTYYGILQRLGVNFTILKEDSNLEDMEKAQLLMKRADLIIDGIFGTGLNSPVRGIFEYAIDMANNSDVRIFSIDIPSGIDSTTGQVLGTSINADTVVTFQFMKEGLYKNIDLLGEIFIEPISIPRLAIDKVLK